ncbi:MAG: bifunctional tetrahydrofolate synthase/dihydrofolate synthase [Pseudomonadales bacterium]
MPMNLPEWLTHIENLHPLKWDLGLERVGEVGRRLDVIKPAPLTFLIAGTNGKGSCCEYLAALCQTRGLRAGKTTSPHLSIFNERIVIDGDVASDVEIVAAFESIDDARGDISLSYFEFSALAALVVFKRSKVDVAILEIGLGGRLDAMNIVEPDVSVITQIAMDHESWLGDSLSKIAVEKAGVMRGGKHCIVADPSPPDSIYECATEKQSQLMLLGQDFGLAAEQAWYTESDGEKCRLALTGNGHLPAASAAAALQAFSCAGYEINQEALTTVIESTRLPGRMQWLQGFKHSLLLDVAHNPNAASYLQDYLRDYLRDRLAAKKGPGRIHAIVGMYGDKDIASVFAILDAQIDRWYLCEMSDPRAASAEELRDALSTEAGSRADTYDKVRIGCDSAFAAAKEDDLVLVFGSFPIVAEVLKITGNVDY